MAPKACSVTALLLAINLLFLSMASATYEPCPTPPVKPPPIKPPCGSCTHPPASCPKDTLKLGVCADLLHLLKVKIGKPPKYPCCSLIKGLVDLEAAVCLCTAIKASILGISLNVPVDLTLLLNYCGKKVPQGFKCV